MSENTGQLRMHSNEKTYRIAVGEAVNQFKISNAALYNRIRKNSWLKEIDPTDNKSYVYIPESEFRKYKLPTPNEVATNPATRQDNPEILEKLVAILKEGYEDRLKDKEEIIQLKDQLIKEKETSYAAAMRELSNAQNALVRYKENRKEKPWWKFWQ